jgi:cell division septum initiation protein DivIVA
MVPRPTRLGRTLFGYRPSHVREFLLERDRLINESESQIHAVRQSEAEARAEIAALRQELAAPDRESASLRQTTDEPPPAPPPDLPLEFVREEAHRIMEATEEGTRRIIQRATDELDRRMEVHTRKEEEIATKIEILNALQASTDEVLGLVRETRIRIHEVPDRLRQALGPLDGIAIGLEEKLDDVIHRSESQKGGAYAVSPNGSAGAEPVVHIPDDGEASLYEPAVPAPPVPFENTD